MPDVVIRSTNAAKRTIIASPIIAPPGTVKRPVSSPSSTRESETDQQIDVTQTEGEKLTLPVVPKNSTDGPSSQTKSKKKLTKKLDFASVVTHFTKPSRNRWQDATKKALTQKKAGDISLYMGKEAVQEYRILYKEYRRWENFPRNDTPRYVRPLRDLFGGQIDLKCFRWDT